MVLRIGLIAMAGLLLLSANVSTDYGVIVSVSSRVTGWSDTGFAVKAGDRFQVRANGSIVHWQNRSGDKVGVCTADGIGTRADANFLAPDLAAVALVGRVGDQVFQLGSLATVTAKAAGTLQLGINESQGGHADNRGDWLVAIAKIDDVLHPGLIFVDAHAAGWSMPAVAVAAGERVRIRAAGEYIYWTSADGSQSKACGPAGTGEAGTRDHLVPAAATLSLVGRLGEKTYAIGTGATIVAETSGTLWLGVNETTDRGWTDNEGQLAVVVEK